MRWCLVVSIRLHLLCTSGIDSTTISGGLLRTVLFPLLVDTATSCPRIVPISVVAVPCSFQLPNCKRMDSVETVFNDLGYENVIKVQGQLDSKAYFGFQCLCSVAWDPRCRCFEWSSSCASTKCTRPPSSGSVLYWPAIEVHVNKLYRNYGIGRVIHHLLALQRGDGFPKVREAVLNMVSPLPLQCIVMCSLFGLEWGFWLIFILLCNQLDIRYTCEWLGFLDDRGLSES